jgi:hypothetical protein
MVREGVGDEQEKKRKKTQEKNWENFGTQSDYIIDNKSEAVKNYAQSILVFFSLFYDCPFDSEQVQMENG